MEEDNEALSDQWWLVALASGAPAFVFWMLRDEQFKGAVMGCAIASVVLVAGFFKPVYGKGAFWLVVAALIVANVAATTIVPISTYDGPSAMILFALIVADGGLSYFILRSIFGRM